MPNNIVYEHDYRKEKKQLLGTVCSDKSELAFQLSQETGVYKAIGDRIRELPHVLNPVKKEFYEKCLAILERYAAHWGGPHRSRIRSSRCKCRIRCTDQRRHHICNIRCNRAIHRSSLRSRDICGLQTPSM